ncbi:DUF2232 domain-containing protein [Cohnella panacarvi]|uniref:DUF2232 domain-containing protein n=1 Tax=Cohnella panacarvi TaxID=400776 RepID=UPI00047C0654|nr:DUF2232 domain-containing protein [Cohnella panacarvi]
MKVSAKSLTWSAAAILILLSILTPLNVVSSLLMMTPFVVLYTMLNPGAFAAHIVPIAVIAFLLSGSYGLVVVTLGLFFLVPSVVMGHLYKKGKPAKTVVITGFVVILAELLLELAILSSQLDFKNEVVSLLTDNLKQFESSFSEGWAAKNAESLTEAMITALPMMLLLTAFFLTTVTHWLSRKALRTVGFEAPALPKAKDWMMPRSLVLYYLIASVASFIMTEESAGYWYVAITNLIPILQFLFLIQAIGFVFFLADAKRWPRFAPFLLCIPLLLFIQPLFLIGMLDVAFPLRRYFVKE